MVVAIPYPDISPALDHAIHNRLAHLIVHVLLIPHPAEYFVDGVVEASSPAAVGSFG